MSGGGGSQSTNTVQKADPWAGVQPYLVDVYKRAQEAANATPSTPYGGQFSAMPTQAQQQGAAGMEGAARALPPDMGQNVLNLGQQTARGDYLQSPYVMEAVNAQVRPLLNSVREQVLPGLGASAASAGAFGDTGHQAQEARVARDTQQVVGDTAAKMLNERFGEERKLQTLAPTLIQQGAGLNMMPAQALFDAGSVQQQLAQQPLNEQLMRWREETEAPWRPIMPYADVLGGLGSIGGGMSSETIGPGQSALSGGIQGGLAGGLGGYGLATALGMSNPLLWGLGGAALLGGLGLFK